MEEREVLYMDPDTFDLSTNNNSGIPIDKNIAETISILNKKGYRTRFSCEGHSDEDNAYIMFDDNVPVDRIEHLVNNTSLWKFKYDNYRIYSRLIIEADIPRIFSYLNENDENNAGYEYIKKAYLVDILKTANMVDEIDISNILQFRPIVRYAKLSKRKLEIVFTLYDFTTFYKEFGHIIKIGEIISVEDNYYDSLLLLKITNIECDGDQINIKAKNIESLGSLLCFVSFIKNDIINKRILFKALNDF